MIIGIDVGGTFTDGVVYSEGRLVRWHKELTDNQRLKETILAVLDKLLHGLDCSRVKRLVVSTTMVTNLFATGQFEQVALVIIPGPGLKPGDLNLPEPYYVVAGAIDFRGREIEPVDKGQIKEVVRQIKALGINKAAVVGKFSQRNPAHEILVASAIREIAPDLEVIMGHQVTGRLNFPRRAATAVYTLAAAPAWRRFVGELTAAIAERGIKADVQIMKADGGTMGITASLNEPCQAIFTGPAASTMGAVALTMDDLTSVVVDIGGTTSDLSLILGGKPLHAYRGARINNRYTHIKALSVRSVPLGGDSVVRMEEGRLVLGPEREGVAACFGGPRATPTDAFNIASAANLGDMAASRQALSVICPDGEAGVDALAREVVDTFVSMLMQNIQEMLREWEQEPLYKVWEVVNGRKASIDRVIGIGAASPAFVPVLASRLSCEGLVHKYAGIGNALGAAVARPTIELVFHMDTGTGTWSTGITSGTLGKEARYQLQDARQLAQEQLAQLARERGIEDYMDQIEIIFEEQFNVIRGWSTTGKIFDIGIGITPGLIEGFKGVLE